MQKFIQALIENRRFSLVCSGFILFFFIGGAIHHSFGFAGIQAGNRSELWHGYSMFMCTLGVFCVLSRREMGFWWLLTTLIIEVAVETRGTLMSFGGAFFTDQLFEVLLDSACLLCVLATKRRYFALPR